MSEIISPKTLGLTYSGEGDLIWADGNLNSLEGSPQVVNGGFYIALKETKSLKYSPTLITGDFVCSFGHIDFIDMPSIQVGGSIKFRFDFEQINEIKNISKLLVKVNLSGLLYFGFLKIVKCVIHFTQR